MWKFSAYVIYKKYCILGPNISSMVTHFHYWIKYFLSPYHVPESVLNRMVTKTNSVPQHLTQCPDVKKLPTNSCWMNTWASSASMAVLSRTIVHRAVPEEIQNPRSRWGKGVGNQGWANCMFLSPTILPQKWRGVGGGHYLSLWNKIKSKIKKRKKCLKSKTDHQR